MPGHTGHPASGDLTSLLEVRSDGSAKLVTTNNAFTKADLSGPEGSALIIHEGADKFANISAALLGRRQARARRADHVHRRRREAVACAVLAPASASAASTSTSTATVTSRPDGGARSRRRVEHHHAGRLRDHDVGEQRNHHDRPRDTDHDDFSVPPTTTTTGPGA